MDTPGARSGGGVHSGRGGREPLQEGLVLASLQPEQVHGGAAAVEWEAHGGRRGGARRGGGSGCREGRDGRRVGRRRLGTRGGGRGGAQERDVDALGSAGGGVQERQSWRKHIVVQERMEGRRRGPCSLVVESCGVRRMQERVQVEGVKGVQVQEVGGGGCGGDRVRRRREGKGELGHPPEGMFDAQEGGALAAQRLLALPPLGAAVLEPHLQREGR